VGEAPRFRQNVEMRVRPVSLWCRIPRHHQSKESIMQYVIMAVEADSDFAARTDPELADE